MPESGRCFCWRREAGPAEDFPVAADPFRFGGGWVQPGAAAGPAGVAAVVAAAPGEPGLVLLCYGWGGKREPCGCCSAFGAATFCWERCWGFWTSGWRPWELSAGGGIYYVPVEPDGAGAGDHRVLFGAVAGGKFRKKPANRLRFRLKAGQREVEFTALVDTGNRLQDPITGRVCWVVQQKVLQNCLPSAVLEAISQGRLEQTKARTGSGARGASHPHAGGTGLLGTFRRRVCGC